MSAPITRRPEHGRDPFAAPRWAPADPVLVTTGRPAKHTHPCSLKIENAWAHAHYHSPAGAIADLGRHFDLVLDEPEIVIEPNPDGVSTWAAQEQATCRR